MKNKLDQQKIIPNNEKIKYQHDKSMFLILVIAESIFIVRSIKELFKIHYQYSIYNTLLFILTFLL